MRENLAYTPFVQMPVKGMIYGYFNDVILEKLNIFLGSEVSPRPPVPDYFPGDISNKPNNNPKYSHL